MFTLRCPNCQILLAAIAAVLAALMVGFLSERAALAQGEACDCVDVALTMVYPGTTSGIMGTAGANRLLVVTVMNHGTRTAYDVEVVVDIVRPEDSLWFRVPAVPIGRVTSMGDTTPAGTQSAGQEGGYSIHWTIPELPGRASANIAANAIVYDWDLTKQPAEQTVDVSLDPIEFFGEVTTASFESNLHKENNTDRVWVMVVSTSSKASERLKANYSIANVSVDRPNPSPGDIVNFTFDARMPEHNIDSQVAIELTGGLSVDEDPDAAPSREISYTYTSPMSTSPSYSNGVITIGSRKHNDRIYALSATLPVRVSSNAVVSEQCLTATVTGNPPPGVGPYNDDISDNVKKLCLGSAPPAAEPFTSGQVDAFTIYPCVDITSAPCDGTNDVRVRAVDSSGQVLAPGTALFQIHPTLARTYDAKTGQSVNDGNTVSWQTAVNPARPYSGLTQGVELYYSRAPYVGKTTGWAGLTFGISARDVGGNTPPPGNVFMRSTFSGNEVRKAESPNYEELRTTATSISTSKIHYFLEFEKLGVYKFTWHAVAKRSSLHGSENCNPTNNVNQIFCASESYTFVVGPIADLSVEDVGASPYVAADRNALAIVAVNNGPDNPSGGATVTGLPKGAEALHISQGTYDSAAGEWNIDELKGKDYYRSRGETAPTLVLSASAGDTASVSIASAENYEVCIGPKSNPGDLAHTTQAACEKVTNASWNSTPVYDHKPDNNTATITAARGTGPGGKGAPTSLETMGHPDYIILVKWAAVATVNDLKVSLYEVQKWVNGKWTTQDSKVKITQWVDENPGEAPRYRVRALNEAGVGGPWSEPVYGKLQVVEGAGVEVDLDPDTTGIQLERTVEEGDEFEYTIKLKSRPSFFVHIRVDADGMTFFPPPVPPHHLPLPVADTGNLITFHPANWDKAKTVKLRVDESLEIDDVKKVKIAHNLPAAGGVNRSAGYGNVSAPELTLTVQDTTYRKVGFKSRGKQTVLMLEGEKGDYTIQPTVKPTDDMTVTLTSSNAAVATIDTDPNTAGSQTTITFRPEDFRAESVTLDDGTELYAVPVSPNGPGRVRVNGLSAGDATISISAVTGDLNFSSEPDSWTGADQAVRVGVTEDGLNAPSFSDAPENKAATVGAPFSYTVPEATDPDNDAITYTASLTGGSALPEWLKFTSASRAFSGTPQVCDAPATLPITVTATDDGPIPQSASATFTLTVTGTLPGHRTVSKEDYRRYAEENNLEPPFDQHYNRVPLFLEGDSTTRSVAENSEADVNVGEPVLACDPDGDTLRYIALDGADGMSFKLNAETGRITTKSGVTYDFEGENSYQFNVIVEEQGTVQGWMSAIRVTVNLIDDPQGTEVAQVNRPPAFDPNIDTILMLPENSAAGTNIGGPISATDPDGHTLTYSLSGDDAAFFDFDGATGQLSAKSEVTYDYETKRWYSVGVTVDDGNGGRIRTYLQVGLTDVNEAPAFSASSATRVVAENSAGGVNVGAAVTATDPDGDTLTYSLSGADASSFEIGNSTGQITTKLGETYDFEAKPSYSLTVTATDDGGGLSDSIAVTVNLTEVEETTTGDDDVGGDSDDDGSDNGDDGSKTEPDPSPPTADAGPDINGKRGAAVILSGLGTAHAEGSQELTYSWRISDASHTELKGVINFLSDTSVARPTFTVPRRKDMTDRSALDDGNSIEFELTVTDGDGESATAKMTLTISGTTWTPG